MGKTRAKVIRNSIKGLLLLGKGGSLTIVRLPRGLVC
jgi:hypothetical protein